MLQPPVLCTSTPSRLLFQGSVMVQRPFIYACSCCVLIFVHTNMIASSRPACRMLDFFINLCVFLCVRVSLGAFLHSPCVSVCAAVLWDYPFDPNSP